MTPYFLQDNFQKKQGSESGFVQSDEFVEARFRKESFRRWLDDERARAAELVFDADAYQDLFDKLGHILEFLGGSIEPNSLAMRSWCFLKLVRPHLVEHESFRSAAKRFGLAPIQLAKLFDQLRISIPGLVAGSAQVVARTTKEKKRASVRAYQLRNLGAEIDSDPFYVPEPDGPRDSSGRLFDVSKHRRDDAGEPRVDVNGRYIPLSAGRPSKLSLRGLGTESVPS